jgi:hypothetical protein
MVDISDLLDHTVPSHHNLGFILMGIWQCNLSCKNNQRNPKSGKKNFVPCMGKIGIASWCNGGHYGFSCWSGLNHTTFWVKEQFATDRVFSICFGNLCNKFLKQEKKFMDTCIVGSKLHVIKYVKDHGNKIAKRHFCPTWMKTMYINDKASGNVYAIREEQILSLFVSLLQNELT